MTNDQAVDTIGQAAPAPPGRLYRAVAAMGRWIGWWMVAGMMVFSGAVSLAAMAGSRTLGFQGVKVLAVMATAAVALGMLLWRRRRTTDGAVAAMILTAGFWVAVWVLTVAGAAP